MLGEPLGFFLPPIWLEFCLVPSAYSLISVNMCPSWSWHGASHTTVSIWSSWSSLLDSLGHWVYGRLRDRIRRAKSTASVVNVCQHRSLFWRHGEVKDLVITQWGQWLFLVFVLPDQHCMWVLAACISIEIGWLHIRDFELPSDRFDFHQQIAHSLNCAGGEMVYLDHMYFSCICMKPPIAGWACWQ